ncbi:hypothetical protein M514_27473 [Trichuris suis]|uniref:Uncharacterized protein n=1 Tax=Trichuris suis TaxID=68888 RepID=A0A085LK03_9BILA|nr:hypothetical protein M513_13866 [Trichuris suis]KFD45299.1 hypothetical protein M513_13823 [Trichuris suis]KFD45309.1 hypothetical protein M513_13813 [Trichuris suis]KFD60343.1 hypothetical protein M514_27473 [Trichuris suis]
MTPHCSGHRHVLHRTEKTVSVDHGGTQLTVAIDRVEPAFIFVHGNGERRSPASNSTESRKKET